jgi:protein phosphatase
MEPKWNQPLEENQDCYSINNERGFFVLADGMGGTKCGAYASNFVVRLVSKEICSSLDKIRNATEEEAVELISSIVRQANSELIKEGEKSKECKGMGTTLDLGILKGEQLYISHVGDAGVYSYDNNCVLKKLTKDDTRVNRLVEKGIAFPESAYFRENDPLTKFIGKNGGLSPCTFSIKLDGIKYIFAATDGITKQLLPEELEKSFMKETEEEILSAIFEIVSQPKGLAELYQKKGELVGEDAISKLANRDDATGIVARVVVK